MCHVAANTWTVYLPTAAPVHPWPLNFEPTICFAIERTDKQFALSNLVSTEALPVADTIERLKVKTVSCKDKEPTITQTNNYTVKQTPFNIHW